ncbi:hypothetical protein B1H10_03245 [candidate division KSB1 bacterium 4484_188]|nr:MAG: hypothetical protein B1H10_03245 [candidate division KSB1 bacterium 4484_188]
MKFASVLLMVLFFIFGCSKEQKVMVHTDKPAKIAPEKFVTTPSGLKYAVMADGRGEQAQPGNKVSVHYSVWSTNGQLYDSSLKRNKPFQFVLGQGRVIPGWDEGVALMKVGDVWQFIVPPQLAYGEKGAGNLIPPNATLIFEVQLLSVK